MKGRRQARDQRVRGLPCLPRRHRRDPGAHSQRGKAREPRALEFIRSEALRRLKDDPPADLAILLRVEERRARLLGLDLKAPAVEVNLLAPDRGAIPIALARQMLRDIQNSGEPIRIDDIEEIDVDRENDSNTDEQLLPVVVSVEEARAAFKALESEDGADERTVKEPSNKPAPGFSRGCPALAAGLKGATAIAAADPAERLLVFFGYLGYIAQNDYFEQCFLVNSRRSKANGRSCSVPQTPKWAKRRNLPPIRQPNQARRTREHLTPDEVQRMMTAARRAGGRLSERDALLIMMAYRHGLRASELVALRWDQVDLKAGMLHVARIKKGSPSTHPLRGPELERCARGSVSKAKQRPTFHIATWRPDDAAHGPLCRRGGRKPRDRVSSPSAHAAPRHRVLLRQRRPGYPRHPALSRP